MHMLTCKVSSSTSKDLLLLGSSCTGHVLDKSFDCTAQCIARSTVLTQLHLVAYVPGSVVGSRWRHKPEVIDYKRESAAVLHSEKSASSRRAQVGHWTNFSLLENTYTEDGLPACLLVYVGGYNNSIFNRRRWARVRFSRTHGTTFR